jgi:hypothetical protein
MKLYLSVIGTAVVTISALNIIFGTASWYYIIIATLLSTALQFGLDGLIAIIINKMPNRYFGVDNPHYDVTEKEKAFYKKIKVKQWKDKVWELGGLGGFSKSHIENPNSPEYIERFIIECNKGVLTHRLSYPIGYLVMLLFPNICAFTVALPVATVNLFLNILPTLALRYNTPKLKLILKRMKRKMA